MTSPHRDLGRIIDKLRDAADHPRPDMGQFANLRDGGNLPPRKDQVRARHILAALAFIFGLALAALAGFHAYAGALDAIANPHIEGF